MNILIPMAGEGSRFKNAGYIDPKPLIKIKGKSMIELAINSLDLDGNYIFIIRSDQKSIKEHLKTLKPNCKIIEVNHLTEGATCTCLLAKKYIDNNQPLVIANCDQIMHWNSEKFMNIIEKRQCDGCVVTYYTTTPKNSYVKLDANGFAIQIAEKEVISNLSLNGIHYWKKGSDFVRSSEEMIRKNIRVNNEFYVAPTYNELIREGKRIINYHIDARQHNAVGTPEDLKRYENLQD